MNVCRNASGVLSRAESAWTVKGEKFVLGLVTNKRSLVLLAFNDSGESTYWTDRVRCNLLCSTVLRFAVELTDYDTENSVESWSKQRMNAGHTCKGLLCVTQSRLFFVQIPRSTSLDQEIPQLECYWEITEIRSFGVVQADLFGIQGGSRCETGSGSFFFRASALAVQQLYRQAIAVGSGRFPAPALEDVRSSSKRGVLVDAVENTTAYYTSRAAVLLRSAQNSAARKRLCSEQAPLPRSTTVAYTHIDIDSVTASAAPRAADCKFLQSFLNFNFFTFFNFFNFVELKRTIEKPNFFLSENLSSEFLSC